MLIKLSKLQSLGNFITAYLNNTDVPVKFAYAMAKNQDKIDRELKPIAAASKALSDFMKKKVDLCNKYADKDEKGKPMVVNNTYVGVDTSIEFRKQFDVLQEEYAAPLKDMEDLMESEVEIEFHMIPLKDFPEKIPGMSILFPLVKEN